MTATLTKNQSTMLQAGLAAIEDLKAQKSAIDEQIQAWYKDLEKTFGAEATMETNDGEVIRWRMYVSHRIPHKKILDEVYEGGTSKLKTYIETRREQEATTAVQRKITSTDRRHGRGVARSNAAKIRMSYGHTKNYSKTAKKYGVTVAHVKKIVNA
jgi:hypothetical protein